MTDLVKALYIQNMQNGWLFSKNRKICMKSVLRTVNEHKLVILRARITPLTSKWVQFRLREKKLQGL